MEPITRRIWIIAKLLIVLGCQSGLHAQVYSNKEVGKKQEQLIDSLKNAEYTYSLPILGKKATKAGFNLPYSAGINVNYLWQESEIIIENLQIGFNHGPLQDISEIVRIHDATSTANAINIRPDIWLLPFLNVYGIFARSAPSTEVDFGVYAPDAEGTWNSVVSLTSVAEFDASTVGFGFTPTIGVGGGWFAFDMNFTWSDIAELEEPAFATVYGPRLGKSFKLKNPERNIAIWVGGFRLQINSETTGSLQLHEVIPVENLQTKVDNGLTKIADSQLRVTDWWASLTPVEQKNPGNIAKYEMANRALNSASEFLSGLDQALNDDEYASVQYSLDKRQKDLWNFIVGTQYQHNKHLMLRLEFGFLGSREQLIAGVQYRFGL